MHDTADAIARDLVRKIGREPALGVSLDAQSWRASQRMLRLTVAVIARG